MQTGQRQTVTAYFSDRSAAKRAEHDLKAAGIAAKDISVLDQTTDGGGFGEAIKRFFTGEDQGDLYSGVLLTVQGDSAVAISILKQCGGKFGTGEPLATDPTVAPGAQRAYESRP